MTDTFDAFVSLMDDIQTDGEGSLTFDLFENAIGFVSP